MKNNIENKQSSVASIGFFDGVHRGHICLIEQVIDEARRRNLRSMLVTFDRHPRTVVSHDSVPTLLTTLEEREQLLRHTGIDELSILPFTWQLSQLTAREFMEKVLKSKLGVSVLVLGYDHTFGHDGGSLEDYMQWGQETGIEIVRAHELECLMVISSKCRRLLEQGRVEQANKMLGRPYSLKGKVVKGFHVGHELGYPTANLRTDNTKLIPALGAYAVLASLDNGTRYEGMLNIGHRPTIGNGEEVSIEVNLLDYEGDLYGQMLSVEFMGRLREERRFSSKDELIAQLSHDETATRKILAHKLA
jgi:riboflavin kinase/FMN adenylyltransferase